MFHDDRSVIWQSDVAVSFESTVLSFFGVDCVVCNP